MTEEPKHVIGLSGGKDSTAMMLRLMEAEPRPYELFCTPTGNELPAMLAHWDMLERLTGRPIKKVSYPGGLYDLIENLQMLPSFHARWCTRILKIEPTIEYMESLPPGSVMYVGLRADEEERQGLYGEGLTVDFPMRRWGWDESQVWKYLDLWGIKIPNRSDCALCYGQRLGEWYALWLNHPEKYYEGVMLELQHGHTFRSNTRDTWPASLLELAAEFERGCVPVGAEAALQESGMCRVCHR